RRDGPLASVPGSRLGAGLGTALGAALPPDSRLGTALGAAALSPESLGAALSLGSRLGTAALSPGLAGPVARAHVVTTLLGTGTARAALPVVAAVARAPVVPVAVPAAASHQGFRLICLYVGLSLRPLRRRGIAAVVHVERRHALLALGLDRVRLGEEGRQFRK